VGRRVTPSDNTSRSIDDEQVPAQHLTMHASPTSCQARYFALQVSACPHCGVGASQLFTSMQADVRLSPPSSGTPASGSVADQVLQTHPAAIAQQLQSTLRAFDAAAAQVVGMDTADWAALSMAQQADHRASRRNLQVDALLFDLSSQPEHGIGSDACSKRPVWGCSALVATN
jgi:hypothetical protein